MLIINGSFLINNITGVERYAIEMSKALGNLVDKPESQLIIAPKEARVDQIHNVSIYTDSVSVGRNRWLWEQIRLPYLLRRFKDYLLWSPANTGPLFISNQIVTIHDVAFLKDENWFSAPNRYYYRFLIPRLARRVKYLMTVSNFSKKEIIKHNLNEDKKIEVIYNSISSSFMSCKNHKIVKPYFVTIGSRDPRKNVVKLIEAWSILNDELEKSPFLKIIGKGNRGFRKEEFQNIPSNVEFTGYLSDEKMIDILKNAQALIYPSLYEGFGLPPLESMSLGVPVLSSDIEPIREVCGQAPLYFDPYSSYDIAQKVKVLLKNKDLRDEMIAKGLERAKLFSWEKSALKLLRLIERIRSFEE